MFKRMKEDGIRPGKVFFNEGSVPKKNWLQETRNAVVLP